MLLGEMGLSPSLTATGYTVADDWVLAVAPDSTTTDPMLFIVAEEGLTGVESSLNAQESSKTYIRRGETTLKTGNSREFSLSGDRVLGDAFQDMVFSREVAWGTGQACIRNYVWFNVLTGYGEQGQMSIIVNSDGGGNAGDSASVDVTMKATGTANTEYIYTGAVVDPPTADPEETTTWDKSNGVWNDSTGTWQDPSLGQPVSSAKE